jgi:hypothetical protein
VIDQADRIFISAEKRFGARHHRSNTMKLSLGWMISAGVIVAATAAGAQTMSPQNGVSPYSSVSDVGRPYAAMPPDSMPPRYAPAVLPPREVYTVVRENGYAPLGAPQPRGMFYSIAVIDPNGDDGRLVIDARDGRIVRFMPAYRMGDEAALSYGAPGPMAPPPVTAFRGVPRPPASVPRVASRSPTGVPLPKAMPRAVAEPKPTAPVAATPAPAPVQQQSAAAPPTAVTPQVAAPAPAAAKPSAQILPTQAMPKAQGLD